MLPTDPTWVPYYGRFHTFSSWRWTRSLMPTLVLFTGAVLLHAVISDTLIRQRNACAFSWPWRPSRVRTLWFVEVRNKSSWPPCRGAGESFGFRDNFLSGERRSRFALDTIVRGRKVYSAGFFVTVPLDSIEIACLDKVSSVFNGTVNRESYEP